MRKELYDDLGVAEDATQEQIKTAYKDLAKQTHPDKPSGDKEKFQQVQLAYSILGNEEKRDRYDKTGQTGKQNFDAVLNGYLNGIIEEVINSGKDIDIVDFLKKCTLENIRQQMKAIEDVGKKRDKIQKLIESYKIKSGADSITPILKEKIKMIQGQQAIMQEGLQQMKDILDVISGYDYEYTPSFVSPNIASVGGWTFQ